MEKIVNDETRWEPNALQKVNIKAEENMTRNERLFQKNLNNLL
jgi:hypothetical protein